MKLHNWTDKVHVTLYMERKHLESLDKLGQESGEARQWVLRTILEKVLPTIEIQPSRVTL